LVHLYVNSSDRDWVDETLRDYRSRIQYFVEREQENYRLDM
jgi:mannose-1-phosphate guanylyltransferase/phosphomannomutase